MIIDVEMHAFANGAIRRVTVPDEVVGADRPHDPTWERQRLLDLTFEYGQNDFARADDLAQRMPSASVGDIIRIPLIEGNGYERWVVTPVGFRRVDNAFTASHDGGAWAYAEK